MSKKALVSVSDKTGLELLLASLCDQDYQIISTGGTAKYIREAGFEVQEVAQLTSFPEMLGGRVKTLHPKVLAGILARRDEAQDLQDLADNDIEEIDLVVVNLYPFAEVIQRENLVYADAIENIDIGGPTLLRSAAKNYQSITVLSDSSQYAEYIEVTKAQDPVALLTLREKLALAVFEHTASYDKLIAQFLKSRADELNSVSLDQESKLPETFSLELELKSKLRYGENPHQQAGLYVDKNAPISALAAAKQLHGKEISYNNYLDLQAAWNIVSEYDETIPCVAIIKHNNPCGVAIAPNIALAYQEALSCDPVSAFGSIVAANKEVDLAAANEMIEIFVEAIIAPSFSAEALEVLKTKKNLRLLEIQVNAKPKNQMNIKRIDGGYLLQENNEFLHDAEKLETVTKTQIDETQWVDLMLAWKVVKHVKSNAIVAVKDGKTIGIGCGQSNRVKSVADALAGADIESRGAVLASDAFFPFADNIAICKQNHISAIIQPGGSIRDQEVIDACDESDIAMVFTKTRHFLH
ncbi:MAG: bifunctional phosphoribosylaminoimidazolecarboxamide formyltransferase/IMP cyclohydrolase [Candidatus Melainabacteria bacterium]|jgi:phosphoribosylaminoimidazolecarboxamide formyltransferase / IMP cyclohydrolase|nr:bifunctional phosphoribosylaminoimidazolecarboxamide formyltransferase/IMP cyclohydrolase [Candidatus Melainabacteria bacterium]